MTTNYFVMDNMAAQYRAERLQEAARERLWSKASKAIAAGREGVLHLVPRHAARV